MFVGFIIAISIALLFSKKWSKRNIILLLLSAIIISLVYYFYSVLDFNKKVSYFDNKQCQLLSTADGPFGSEDLAALDNGIYLISSGDLGQILFKSDLPLRKGAIWLVNLQIPSNMPINEQLRKVEIKDMPTDLAFQPHGIYYSTNTQKLYAVSHGYDLGGERIFIFNVDRNPNEDFNNSDYSADHVTLTFNTTIALPCGNGMINDVVEGSFFGEIYYTQYIIFPHPQNRKPLSFAETLNSFGNMLGNSMPLTSIHRCVFSPTSTNFSVAATGFNGANGITTNGNRSKIWIIDVKRAHQLNREIDGSLTLEQSINLAHCGDNIDWDEETNSLYFGTIPILHLGVSKIMGDQKVQVPGGLTVIKLENGKMGDTQDVIIHDGSQLNMVGCGSVYKKSVLLGSPASRGVLRCEQ